MLKVDNINIKKSLEDVIEALLECEEKKKNCRKCKLRKRGCLLFMRDSIAVALQFILANMNVQTPAGKIYS